MPRYWLIDKKFGFDRRTALQGLAGALGALGPTATTTAQPGGDNRNRRACDVVVPIDEPTIQAAVDSASPGDVICVQAVGGPYS